MAYSRAEYEFDMAEIEESRHITRKCLLLGLIGGFELNKRMARLDERENSCTWKLRGIAKAIGDREKAKREKQNKLITDKEQAKRQLLVPKPAA
jgi:hypothetical protein